MTAKRERTPEEWIQIMGGTLDDFKHLQEQRALARSLNITQPLIFESKEDLISRLNPLLGEVTEYEHSGLLQRALELFNQEIPKLNCKEQDIRLGVSGAQEIYDQALKTFTEDLMANHPLEWRAWERSTLMIEVSMSGLEQGVISMGELKTLRGEAEHRYQEAHK